MKVLERSWLQRFDNYLRELALTRGLQSGDATRLAFQNGLNADGELLMEMIRCHNKSSHGPRQQRQGQPVRQLRRTRQHRLIY